MINSHKRTLVCVIAQTRDHKLTWTNFNKYVIKTLNADLAICVSKDKNYNFNNYQYYDFKQIKEQINSKIYFSGLLNQSAYHLNPLKYLYGIL